MKSKLTIFAAILMLAIAAGPGYAGDPWGLGNFWGFGSGSLVLDEDTDRQAFRFTAQRDLTVDTAHVHVNAATADTDVELRADDGSGNPGTVLATATLPTSGGTNVETPLSTSVSLTKGDIYHFVTARNGGAGTIFLRIGSPARSNHDAFTGIFDPNMTLLQSVNGGATYTDGGTATSLRYGLSDSGSGEAVGHPYDTLTNVNQSDFGGSTWAGQTFVAPNDWFVNSIEMQVLRHVSSPADDVRVHLIRTSDNTEIYSDTFVSPGAIGSNEFATVTNILPALTVTVEAGETYALMLESVASGVREWQVLGNRATSSQTNLQNANFQGDLGQQVLATSPTTNPPVAYNSVDFSGLRHDAFFVLDVTPSKVEITDVFAGDTTGFEFLSDTGTLYRLQHGTGPVVTNWTDAGLWILGDGGTLNAFDPAGFDTNKTYRLNFAP